jgi:Protein of unknown function (DUF3325)
MSAALLAGVLAATYLGFALLALSQDRHWHHLGGARRCPPRTAFSLRVTGYVLLSVSLGLSVVRDGASFGAVLWATALCVCAFAVLCTLTWRMRWLEPLALVCRKFA